MLTLLYLSCASYVCTSVNYVGDFAYHFILFSKFCDKPDSHQHSLTICTDVTYSAVCLVTRAGNWWKITARNRTIVNFGEPLQTVVNNCNLQFTRHTK